MFYAVKVNEKGDVIDSLKEVFQTHRECFMAARMAFCEAGRLMFPKSRLLMR